MMNESVNRVESWIVLIVVTQTRKTRHIFYELVV